MDEGGYELKITKVEIFPVTIQKTQNLTGVEKNVIPGSSLGTWQYCRFVVAKVHTDEGAIGLGESPPWLPVSREAQSSIVAIIKDYLAPAVMGENPFNIVDLSRKMEKVCPGNPMARNVLDMAFYDIVAKAFNTPLYNILGGKVRDRIPLTGLVGFSTVPNMVKSAGWWFNKGYRTIRFKIGRGLGIDEELMAALRKEFGDQLNIRVDVNQAYGTRDAIKLINMLEEYDVECVEQPTAWHDLRGLSHINKTVRMPVMLHESVYDIYDIVNLIEHDAVSLLGLKLDRPGGISNFKKAVALSELYNIPCTVISSQELGISTAASMQLAATLKKLDFACEATGPLMIEDDIVMESIKIEDGYAIVPDGVGVGVELDEEKLKKYSEYVVVCDESSKPLL